MSLIPSLAGAAFAGASPTAAQKHKLAEALSNALVYKARSLHIPIIFTVLFD
jgi:phenylpyruvate tautomerase PptA (4-oxalocrotonate tautomerase family)